jgi:phosphoenolpyruvate carboxykinase (ATP)
MYQFISGYTAKIAGTETGITAPKATFSACFGAPFLPLHPAVYTKLLGERLSVHKPKVWLVNTGWTGGRFGTGQRMLLKDTRAIVNAILNGELDHVSYAVNNVFGWRIPLTCPGIDSHLLDPRNTWKDKDAYDQTANELALRFHNNFEQYADRVTAEIVHASPKVFA